MKKFICLILVLSLLVSSVGAVEVYEVEPDTKVSLMSSAVTLAEVTDTQLDNLFRQYFLGSSTIETVGYLLDQIFGHVLVIRSALDSGTSPLFYIRSGSYLSSSGGQSTVTSSNIYLGELVRSGFLGLKNVIENQSQYDYSTVLSQILTSVDNVYSRLNTVNSSVGNVNSSVGQVNTSVGQVNTSVGQVNTSVGQVNSSLVSYLGSSGPLYDLLSDLVFLPDGIYIDSYGNEQAYSSPSFSFTIANGFRGLINSTRVFPNSTVLSSSGDAVSIGSESWLLGSVVNNGFLGLRSLLTIPSGSSYLDSDGDSSSVSYDLDVAEVLSDGFLGLRSLITMKNPNYLTPTGTLGKYSGTASIDNLFRDSMLGLRSLIAGSASENEYSGISINNENLSSSFTATGLGPMLNTWLGDIQNDLGVLSYVFASPQDLELKKESESNMDAVGETILSSDSKSSVKVKDITDISAASDSIQELGETGVTPGQAFEQLINGSQFGFFSQEVYNDLHTVPQSRISSPSTEIVTNFYEQSREEFYSMIGKG